MLNDDLPGLILFLRMDAFCIIWVNHLMPLKIFCNYLDNWP